MVGGIPSGFIRHHTHRTAFGAVALGKTQEGIFAAQIFGGRPRAIVAHPFDRTERRNTIECFKVHSTQCTPVAIYADSRLQKRRFDAGFVGNIRRTRRSKIAVRGEVRAFAVFDALHQFGNQKIQIRKALPVRVRGHIDGHSIDGRRKIGSVVEVKTA